MGVIIIKFSVYNQRLRRITSGTIPSNSFGKLKFEFDFRTEDWDMIEDKTANFYYQGTNYRIKLDKYNQCFVPKQVIHDPLFSVSIDGGDIITNSIKIPIEAAQKATATPDIDSGLDSDGLLILDGGLIALDSINDSVEDNEPDKTDIIDYIIENELPIYVGIVGEEPSQVEYMQLDASTANYTDQGFYITTDNDGEITNVGYQITFEGNDESVAQTFSMYSTAKIVRAYQYHTAFNQWTQVEFDGTYWIEDGIATKIINGQKVSYTTYSYNVDVMGDAITTPEYWRFEVEVL